MVVVLLLNINWGPIWFLHSSFAGYHHCESRLIVLPADLPTPSNLPLLPALDPSTLDVGPQQPSLGDAEEQAQSVLGAGRQPPAWALQRGMKTPRLILVCRSFHP